MVNKFPQSKSASGNVLASLELTMDQNVESNGESMNIVTLPSELLVYILSFLNNVCYIAKLRIVSRRLRSVCETPLLWREFIWPHLDIHEQRYVKNLLKLYGQYVKQLSFSDHVMVMPPVEFTAMLRHCVNLVELHIPTTKLSCDQLGNALKRMDVLQRLDVSWESEIDPLIIICSRLKELTIRTIGKSCFYSPVDSWLDNWVMKGFHPLMLNFVVGQCISALRNLVGKWLQLNPCSLTGHTGCLNFFNSLKVPMDLFPALPDFQLNFGQLCTLPFVKPSKCGLLGLEEEDILLIDTDYGNKAVMMGCNVGIECSHFNGDVNGLSFVTQFDASEWQIEPGHLEQLATACPNLQYLDLERNFHCLKRLRGLHVIAACCRNLQGLNLLNVSEVESDVQLWKILVDMRLTYLAIDLCVLIPQEENGQAKPEIINSFHKCSKLKSLEFQKSACCPGCKDKRDLSVLSSFPSLVHCFVSNFSADIEIILNSCSKLKYITYACHCSEFSKQLPIQNENLEQLCIRSVSPEHVRIPAIFMQSVSAHGRLVHVVLRVGILYADGITALIENSYELLTCHIYSRFFLKTSGSYEYFTVNELEIMLKKKFSKRKLFTCGSFDLSCTQSIEDLLIKCNADILSLWSTMYSGCKFACDFIPVL